MAERIQSSETAGVRTFGAEVLRNKYRVGIVRSRGRGSTAENELVGRIAGSLVGLEHLIGPAVAFGKCQVRSQRSGRAHAVRIVEGDGGILHKRVGPVGRQ